MFFRGLKLDGHISEKEISILCTNIKKLPIWENYISRDYNHKRLHHIPGRPVILNCGIPTEKVSEFLDHHLKPIMQEEWSYINDNKDFLKKIQNMRKFPQDSILVTADVVGLYASIPHNSGLKALKDALDCRQNKKIPTDMLVKMAEFVLTNNYFEFGQKVFHQISGTAIGTKFAQPCIFMDKFETNLSHLSGLGI